MTSDGVFPYHKRHTVDKCVNCGEKKWMTIEHNLPWLTRIVRLHCFKCGSDEGFETYLVEGTDRMLKEGC